MDEAKKKIIQIFRDKVKGKKADVSGRNEKHDGKEGNWLEEQFGKSPDADNHADFWGYELKNQITSKTTFGDWSANTYIFKTGEYVKYFKNSTIGTPQDNFCCMFGKPNIEKNNRYSWSGTPCPKISGFNNFGQKLLIDENKDIVAVYSYSQDKRENKDSIIPVELQKDYLELARWYGKVSPTTKRKDKCLKSKLEDKFNDKGWFTCKKNENGEYCQICFGEPMDYDKWITLVEKEIVFFDSGMYQGNNRPYSQWRANNSFWDSLITEIYD